MDGHCLLKSEEIKYQSAINIMRNNVVQQQTESTFRDILCKGVSL